MHLLIDPATYTYIVTIIVYTYTYIITYDMAIYTRGFSSSNCKVGLSSAVRNLQIEVINKGYYVRMVL